MDDKKIEQQWTMKIVRFEAGVLQTGTASNSPRESSVVLNLNVQTNSGQNNPKSL